MYDLVTRTERRDDLLLSDRITIATYTLDHQYVTTYQVWYGETKLDRKIQPFGSVMALDPSSRKVVPNFASYGFGIMGVLLNDELVQFGDKEVAIIFEGEINEKAIWDDGAYQNLLDATRVALRGRINFIDADQLDD